MSNNIQFDESKTAWISRGFEQLVREAGNGAPRYDVVIVGSGYGGAIAAATFAGRRHGDDESKISVCVLERGREYLPGAFPGGFGEIPAHIRMQNRKSGLFDVRQGPEVSTVVANGLGGGSLINAGVMEVPAREVFQKHWPAALSDRATLDPYYERAKEMLGATRNGNDNTIEDHPDGIPKKFLSLRNLSPHAADFRPAAITVAMDDTSSSANVALNKCIRCGDCATGCNHGAKDSLDVNLLVKAYLAGAEIYSGATVLRIERDNAESEWVVTVVYTDAKLRARQGDPVQILAKKVVLAAGTLGSTEILKRSESENLCFSYQLGRRCSTNGDTIITDFDTDSEVNAVADETVRPSERAVGPTITGVVDLRGKSGVVIEEMAVPAGLRRAFAEIFSTVDTLHSLNEPDCSTHTDGWPDDDIFSASPDRVNRSAVYAVMGDDGAGGRIELRGGLGDDRDGVARIRWEGLQRRPIFEEQLKVLTRLTEKTNGRILPNPVWKLLPSELSFLFKNREGPLLTVHPLGGCTMADGAEFGVVNHLGEVFNPAASVDDLHEGLVVLDGSIVPTALGTNPALTIASVALRAAESLADKWNFAGAANREAAVDQLARPVFREVDRAHRPEPTRVELDERMVGPVAFTDAGGMEHRCVVEWTLRTEDKAVNELTYPTAPGGVPELRVDERQTHAATDSRIRFYDVETWERINLERVSASEMERRLNAAALYEAPLSGTLQVLKRGRTRPWARLLRAGWAWLLNRGLRDGYQAIVDGDDGPGFLIRLKGFFALASRAGEFRLLRYELRMGDPVPGNQFELADNRIIGEKRFTYERRANPWTQLMEVSLVRFPGLTGRRRKSVLKLDLEFLARIGVPLFKIKGQADGATALAELVSFFAYFVRLLIGIHIWSFRSPDEDRQLRQPVRLPGELPGMPPPEIHELHLGSEVPDFADKGVPVPVDIRLTRYARPESVRSPILMIHGYSASGTTFAHPSVDPNFASYFWHRDRDVWILDMRTSSGMDTATSPWSFEQAAHRDIPAACHHIYQETGKQIDVVAHCMGAAMFSMAVLHSVEPKRSDESFLNAQARHDLKDRIRRVAFTQVGPLVVFSPINIFRGYVARYLLDFLPDHYTFRPGPDATLADHLFDRILSTLPYPKDEFDIENPPWRFWRRTPWVRTRHRMDALYGRDFNVANIGQVVLDHIDDHFGPMSIKTVAQTIHFSRYNMITNKEGRNTFVSRKQFGMTWDFPAHSVHARHNGLSDVATVVRMNDILSDSGRVYDYTIIGRTENAGHQDALIGRARSETFEIVERFFEDGTLGRPGPIGIDMKAYSPWIGPIVTDEPPQEMPQSFSRSIRIGTRPTHRVPVGVVLMRVTFDGNGFQRPDGQPIDAEYIRRNMIVFTSLTLREEGWDRFWLPETNVASPQAGNGVLVLVVYDEADRLGSVEIGETNYFRFDPLARTWFVDNVPPLDWEPILRTQAETETEIPFDDVQSLAVARNELTGDSEPNKFIRLMVDAVLAALDDTPADLVVLPNQESQGKHRDILDTPLKYGFRDKDDNVAPAKFEQDIDLARGFIPDPPSEGAGFALISCQYPAGFLDGSVAYEAYAHVARRIGEGNGITPRFAVLTGDQVYVDATAGLYDPTRNDDRYEQPYSEWLRDEHVRNVLRQVPSFMMLDDHEIDDNWEPVDPAVGISAENQAMQQRGLWSYTKYQRGLIFGPSMSFSFSFRGSDFFMLDTRTARERRTASNVETRSLVNAVDLPDLEAWLQQGDGPKFIVSPAMLLPRHRRPSQWNQVASAICSDGWDGYPDTLYKVLELIARNDTPHVVFLSGDEHRGCVATVDITDTDTGNVTRIHSIHTQGAYTPFPFANSLEEDFIKNERFTFDTGEGKTYECSVDTLFQSRQNGVTYLNPKVENEVWKLDYQFGDDAVTTIDI